MVFKEPKDILAVALLAVVGVYLVSYFSKEEGFADMDEVQKLIALVQQTVKKIRMALTESSKLEKKQELKLSKIESDAASVLTWWTKQDPIQKSANMQILYSPQIQNILMDVNDLITDSKLNIQPLPLVTDNGSRTFTR